MILGTIKEKTHALPLQHDCQAAIEMFTGHEVFELFSDLDFLLQWDALYAACPWSTVFQSRKFTVTWYMHYKVDQWPILIRSFTGDKLTGLLALALPVRFVENKSLKGRIAGAGQYEAEYHCWLSENTSYGEIFIQQALEQVCSAFPEHDVFFRNIPAEAPLQWAFENPKWKKLAVLEPYQRPYMDLSAPELPALLNKGQFRNKLNRLKRNGEVRFEKITDPEAFAALLPKLTLMYDFRQSAMYNKVHFIGKPHGQTFLIELFEQKLLHVTVLTVEDEVVASIVAVTDRGWVHLSGINVHAPFNSYNTSPGFLHFMLLGQLLLKEGMAAFDLTPGGDSYKERLATHHDQVHELVIPSGFVNQIKRRARKYFFSKLINAGKSPLVVMTDFFKKRYILKSRLQAKSGLLRHVLSGKNSYLGKEQWELYQLEPLAGERIPVTVNDLSALLSFRPDGYGLSRWEFLEDSMRRLESGERCFTCTMNGMLLSCMWLAGPKTVLPLPTPEGAAVIHKVYYHASAKTMLAEAITSTVEEVKQHSGPSSLFFLVPTGDRPIFKVVNKLARGKAYKPQPVVLN